MSYREIGQKLDLTRPAVESALFRARRRLETEYEEIADGRRCTAMRATLARMVQGTHRGPEEHRLARHVKRCHSCRHRARVLGIQPKSALGSVREKAAALLPLPWLFRRGGGDGGGVGGLFSAGANATPLAERAVALVAAAALAGAGGAALEGGVLTGDREAAGENRLAADHSAAVRGESQRGATGTAPNGERAGARQASGRESSGSAGGRVGDSGPIEPPAQSGGESAIAPGAAAPGVPELPAAPALPDAGPRSGAPSAEVEIRVPDITPVAPEGPACSLPPVEVPAVELPAPEDVAGALPDALP
jgi:hypothetical protein